MDNPNTYRVALLPLTSLYGHLETNELTTEKVTSLVSRMEGSTFMFLTVLKIFARYCHWANVPCVNPNLIRVRRQHDPEHQRHLTEEEIETMCSALDDDTFLGVRNRLIIRMLFETGCRLSELLSLTLSEINAQENSVKIVTEKSKIQRYIMWSWETHRLLQTYLGMRVSKDWKTDRLFIGRYGDILKPRGVQHMFAKISEESLGERHHPHECRHGKVHHLIRNKYGRGVPNPVEIARIMGHKNLESVFTYFRLSAKDSYEILKKYI